MSRKAKLYQKAIDSPNNFSFNELCALASEFGFELKRTNGSHHIYKRRTDPKHTISFQRSKDGKAKAYLVRELIDFIEGNNLIDPGE